MEIYKLLIYLNEHGRLFFIESVTGEDKDSLEQEARDRKSNNPDYVAIVGGYILDSAILV